MYSRHLKECKNEFSNFKSSRDEFKSIVDTKAPNIFQLYLEQHIFENKPSSSYWRMKPELTLLILKIADNNKNKCENIYPCLGFVKVQLASPVSPTIIKSFLLAMSWSIRL